MNNSCKDTPVGLDADNQGADADEKNFVRSEANTAMESNAQSDDRMGMIPLKMRGWTLALRVEPPKRTTSPMFAFLVIASFSTCSAGVKVLGGGRG